LNALRTLETTQLSKLKLLTECDGRANFEQIWALEYIARGEDRWDKEALRIELEHLIDIGILKIIDEKIHFAGDEFDKIYAKYLAREQSVTLGFPDFSLEAYWHTRLRGIVRKINEDLTIMPIIPFHDAEVDLVGLVSRLQDKDDKGDIFVENPPLIRDLYNAMIVYRFKEVLPVLELRLALPWMRCQTFCYCSKPDRVELLEKLAPRIEDLAARVEKVNGELVLERIELPVVLSTDLAVKVEKSANKFWRELIALGHGYWMAEAYTVDSNVEEALFHGDFCIRYEPDPAAATCNNLGYLYMAAGDPKKARFLLEKAVAVSKKPSTSCLATYNLGILEARSGNVKKAVERVRSSVEEAKLLKIAERKCACLFVPKVYAGELKFEEDKEMPDLLKTAERALEVLESEIL
jgi:tetratricopeptide (TPR) repeat protein